MSKITVHRSKYVYHWFFIFVLTNTATQRCHLKSMEKEIPVLMSVLRTVCLSYRSKFLIQLFRQKMGYSARSHIVLYYISLRTVWYSILENAYSSPNLLMYIKLERVLNNSCQSFALNWSWPLNQDFSKTIPYFFLMQQCLGFR